MQWQILRKCEADALRKKIFTKPKASVNAEAFFMEKNRTIILNSKYI